MPCTSHVILAFAAAILASTVIIHAFKAKPGFKVNYLHFWFLGFCKLKIEIASIEMEGPHHHEKMHRDICHLMLWLQRKYVLERFVYIGNYL